MTSVAVGYRERPPESPAVQDPELGLTNRYEGFVLSTGFADVQLHLGKGGTLTVSDSGLVFERGRRRVAIPASALKGVKRSPQEKLYRQQWIKVMFREGDRSRTWTLRETIHLTGLGVAEDRLATIATAIEALIERTRSRR